MDKRDYLESLDERAKKKLALQIGDCPNISLQVLDLEICWSVIRKYHYWQLQENLFTGHARILNDKRYRVAWGSKEIMAEKFDRLTGESFLRPGDVIGISRKRALNIYDHYGIYAGEERVIHYVQEGDSLKESVIKETDLRDFLKEDKDYFILYFSKKTTIPQKIQSTTAFTINDPVLRNNVQLGSPADFCLYSPEETVQRARSRLGEREYSLVSNNCEHFAIWCKTGVAESYQVKNVIDKVYKRLLRYPYVYIQ